MKKNMLKETLRALDVLSGPFTQLLKNLQGKNGEVWLTEFKRFLRQEPCWTKIQKMTRGTILATKFLYLFPFFNELKIGKLDGKRVIDQQSEIFPAGQKLFSAFRLTKPGKKTKATRFLAYRPKKVGSLEDFFNSFGCSLNDLCVTQDQIAELFAMYPQIVDQGDCLMLFKKDYELPAENDNLFVAVISHRSKDQDHARDYQLFAEALPMGIYGDNVAITAPGNSQKFGERSIILIPETKTKNYLIRASNWLAENS